MINIVGLIQSGRAATVAALLALAGACHSQTIDIDNFLTPAKWSYQLSTDAWRIRTNTDPDYLPGFIEQNSNLLLPNSYTKWPYKNLSLAGWVTSEKMISQDIQLSLKARADQTLGSRVDQAQIQKNISPSLGIRAGIVDYKTSWCRTYEADNGWMREIEAICNTPQFRDVTGGAPGLQVFSQHTVHDYLIQTQVGIYDPLILKYASTEFGNLTPSPQFTVTSNKKIGFNVNALNLWNSLEARMSYIQTRQVGYSPESNLLGQTKQESDLIYLGVNTPITQNISGRITHTRQNQHSVCRSSVAPIGSSCNLNLQGNKALTSIELSYHLNRTNVISAGASKTRTAIHQQIFTPAADIFAQVDPDEIDSTQLSVAWRRDWSQSIFTIIQHIHSKQTTTHSSFEFPSKGSATGFRLGYRY